MQPADLFSTIAQIRQDIETLIKRGKPIDHTELEQLIDAVKAQSRPQLNPVLVAEQLAPYLQARVTVPEAVHQASVHASIAITQAIQQAAAQSEARILQASHQGEKKILQAVTGIQKAVQTIPQQIEVRGEVVGFTSKWAAYLLLGFATLMMLIMAWAVASRSSMQSELAEVEVKNKRMAYWISFYLEHRKELIKNHPAIGYYYFPHAGDPKPKASSPVQGRK